MSAATEPRATESTADPVASDRLYRLSLDQYHQMAKAGILKECAPIVLLDGLLVTKMTKGDPHVTSVRLGQKALERILPDGWIIGKEDPIALPKGQAGRDSEPEPDLNVLRGAIRDYARRKPLPSDVALIVEVADSSLAEDRKGLARYAWATIPTVWIVNLNARSIEVYTKPTGPGEPPGYQARRDYGPGEEVPVVLDGVEIGRIAVADLLP